MGVTGEAGAKGGEDQHAAGAIDNRNATHPANAMLNYAYAVARSQVHIEVAAEGYDACRGIMHHDRQDTQAFVYDLIEPRRPIVDAAVLGFIRSNEFTGADFTLRADGVCRVTPQLTRIISQFISELRQL